MNSPLHQKTLHNPELSITFTCNYWLLPHPHMLFSIALKYIAMHNYTFHCHICTFPPSLTDCSFICCSALHYTTLSYIAMHNTFLAIFAIFALLSLTAPSDISLYYTTLQCMIHFLQFLHFSPPLTDCSLSCLWSRKPAVGCDQPWINIQHWPMIIRRIRMSRMIRMIIAFLDACIANKLWKNWLKS